MKQSARVFTGIIVSCVVTGLGAIAVAADKPAKSAPPATQMQPDRAAAHKEMIQRHLDSLASRLEIKASQQSAWQAYAAAVQALIETGAARPGPDADAATLTRDRAERATVFARKLTAVADATARLQGALTQDQRAVLDQVTREAGRRHRMAGFGPDGSGPMMMLEHERIFDGRRSDDDKVRERVFREHGWTEPMAPRADRDDGADD